MLCYIFKKNIYIVLYYIILYYIVLHYDILYYDILYYDILYYIILHTYNWGITMYITIYNYIYIYMTLRKMFGATFRAPVPAWLCVAA